MATSLSCLPKVGDPQGSGATTRVAQRHNTFLPYLEKETPTCQPMHENNSHSLFGQICGIALVNATYFNKNKDGIEGE
jgi:hypothetical protein